MTVPFADIGGAIAQEMLERITDALALIAVDPPGWSGQVGGVGPPTVDACDGLIWTRVASVYPTDGSGLQLTATRFDSSIPAWVVSVELGHLWCHPVIESDGDSPDMATWQAMALRDSQYRLVMLQAARSFRDDASATLRAAIMGQTIGPWVPVGPDGGYSGGLLVVDTIVGALALCT